MRQKVQMQDPIFGSGEARTAKAPIAVSPAGVACRAELWLSSDGGVTKAATSGLVAFTSTGAQQNVSLPVTLPAGEGLEYAVYLDIFANSSQLAAYVATESVIIPSASVGPITWE